MAWPWAPIGTMGPYIPKPEAPAELHHHCNWYPSSPPFEAHTPTSLDMIAGIRFKQGQKFKSAALEHGRYLRKLLDNGGRAEDLESCWHTLVSDSDEDDDDSDGTYVAMMSGVNRLGCKQR